MKFKTGDKVRVMRGKDAGKEGQITKVLKSCLLYTSDAADE